MLDIYRDGSRNSVCYLDINGGDVTKHVHVAINDNDGRDTLVVHHV